MTLELSEEERQMTLLALGHLAAQRPGWTESLEGVAGKMDNQNADGRPELFTKFRQMKEAELKRD